MADLLTQSQFAKLICQSRQHVSKLKQAGRLVLDGKLVDVAASIKRIAETEGGRPDVAERHAQQRSAPAAPPAEIGLGEQAEGSRAKFKAMAMHFENQSIKLEMALRRGLRFDKAALKDEAHGLGNTLRAALERLIDQTAPRLAMLKTRNERMRLLEIEKQALRRLVKGEFPRALRRMKKRGAST
jgi:hypothetical protein